MTKRLKVLLGLAGLSLFGLWAAAQTDLEFQIQLTYDSLGRIASITHPRTGAIQSYAYNAGGLQTSVAYDGGAVVSDAEYTAGKQPAVVAVAPYQAMPGGQIRRTYDPLNRLASQEIDIGGALYRAHGLTYDAWGFLSSLTRDDPALQASLAYAYGERGELTDFQIAGLGAASYQYDDSGNLIGRSGFTSGGLSLPPIQGAAYDPQTNHRQGWVYDPDGKLLEDDRFRYEYNALERIKIVRDKAGWIVAQYRYDGWGNRARTIVEDLVIDDVRLPDGRLISQEVRRAGLDGTYAVTQKDYVYFNGQPILTVSHHPDGTVARQYQFRDRLGHPVVVLDEANGFQPERREYAPFGEMMTAEPANPTTHEFTGHQRDHAVALDYMQARYYQPRTARFTRPDPGQAFDPINPFSYNLYNYAYNNPVNLADPTGAHPVVVGILIAAKAVDVGFTVYSIYQDVQAIWRGETTAAAVLEEKGVEYAIGLGIHSGARAAYKLGKGPFGWIKKRFSKGRTGLPDAGDPSKGKLVSSAGISKNTPRRVGDLLETIDDVLANPNLLAGKSPEHMNMILRNTPGWHVETLGKGSNKGKGWVLREYTNENNPTGRMLRWHPGGGRHGPDPYWRVIDYNKDSGIIR